MRLACPPEPARWSSTACATPTSKARPCTTLELADEVALLEHGAIVERVPRAALDAGAPNRVRTFPGAGGYGVNVLGYLRTFVRARPGIVILSLALWLAQSLAELAPGLIVKRFFDALQQQAFAHASQSVLMLLVFAAGFAGIVMATAVASARLRFHVAGALRRGILEAILHRPPASARPSVGAHSLPRATTRRHWRTGWPLP